MLRSRLHAVHSISARRHRGHAWLPTVDNLTGGMTKRLVPAERRARPRCQLKGLIEFQHDWMGLSILAQYCILSNVEHQRCGQNVSGCMSAVPLHSEQTGVDALDMLECQPVHYYDSPDGNATVRPSRLQR